MSIYQKADGRWNVVYRENGKRHDKSFPRGEEGLKAAQEFDAYWCKIKEAEEAQNQKRLTVLEQPKSTNEITFGELAREYIQHSQSNGSTDNHLKSLAYEIRGRLYPMFGKDTPIREIDYGRHILPFMNQLRQEKNPAGEPLSKVTINHYGHLLCALFNYAVEREYITKNPMKLWRKIPVAKKNVQLTFEDFLKIWSCAPDHVKWAMEVCINLGVRPGESELLSIKWKDVDFEKNEILIYGRKTKTYRTIPIREDFKERLLERKSKARTEYLIEFRGRPLKKIRKAFQRAVQKAGITYPVRMYDIRHLFATLLIDNGIPISTVSLLMGHARMSTTLDWYCHTPQSESRKAIGSLPSLKEMTSPQA